MESVDNTEMINKICNRKEKKKEEMSLRRLWQECFDDPLTYIDFYFASVYQKNIIYTIRDRGMVHLNPYSCMVQEREMMLHYVVGVATKKSERRKGIMRRLLWQAMSDMYQNKEPFTYLMPADERYYQPFDFASISRKQETVSDGGLNPATNTELSLTAYRGGSYLPSDIQFVKYKDILSLFEQEEQQGLFRRIGQMLSERYSIYAKHDKSYFDLLLEEKKCQGGDVIFCFEGEMEIEKVKGFFAYGIEKEKLFVEQYLIKDVKIESILSLYHPGKTVIVHQFPFMVRIIHAETFLMLFAKQFFSFAKEEKRLLITDPVLTENNGIYVFSIREDRIFVKKRKGARTESEMMWDVKMTVKELADFVFLKQNEGASHVFFAEVV